MSAMARRSPRERAAVTALLALLLAACTTTRRPPPPLPGPVPVPPPPADILSIPDAVPRAEPRSAHGNPSFYDALGRRYFVLPSAEGYDERGVASWYGP